MEAGKKLSAAKDYGRAILEFKSAAQAVPADPEPVYQLAIVYMAIRDWRETILHLKKAIELDPKHLPSQLKLAELMATSRRPEVLQEAEQKAQEALAVSPGNVQALTALAMAEWGQNQRESAEQHLERAFASAPQNLGTLISLAKMKLSRGDRAGAEEALRKAAAVDPPVAEVLAALGEFLILTGKTEEGERSLRRALEVNPKYWPALLDLARTQYASGRLKEAEESYKKLSAGGERAHKPTYAAFLLRIGRQADAVAEFERLAKEDPEDRGARSRLVSSYIIVKRTADAESLLARAIAKNPKDLDALLQRSSIHLAAGRIEDAARDIKQVLQYDAGSPQAHYLLSRVHGARGESKSQRHELSEALKADRRFSLARIELAQLLIATNEPQAALDLLNEVDDPYNIEILVQKNWAWIRKQDKAAARRGVQQGLSLAPVPALFLQDAMLKFDEGKYAAARASIDEVLKRDPQDIRALELLIGINVKEKKVSAGVQQIREHVAKSPNSAELQLFLGRLLYATGNHQDARKAFLAAKSADPKGFEADVLLAQSDLAERKMEDARKRISGTLSANPKNLPALILLAQLEETSGNRDAAITQYQGILDLDAQNVRVLNNLAYNLAEAGKVDQALPYAERAKELAPGDAKVDDTMGWVYYRKGLYSRAILHLEQAVAKEPTALVKCHLAMAYLRAGNEQKGRETLMAATRLEPNLPEIKQAQQVLKEVVAEAAKSR